MPQHKARTKAKTQSAQTVAFVRVSSDKQSVDSQRLAILDYCDKGNIKIHDWMEINASTRKVSTQKRISEVVSQLNKGDLLIVSEMSRLGRSVGQVITLIDRLVKNRIRFISIKEGIELTGKPNIQSKTMLTMFSLFAEIERDLISERTKEGLARAKAAGVRLGRQKGTLGPSKLDIHKAEIKKFLDGGINKTNLARYYNVSWSTMDNFIKTRKLAQTER